MVQDTEPDPGPTLDQNAGTLDQTVQTAQIEPSEASIPAAQLLDDYFARKITFWTDGPRLVWYDHSSSMTFAEEAHLLSRQAELVRYLTTPPTPEQVQANMAKFAALHPAGLPSV